MSLAIYLPIAFMVVFVLGWMLGYREGKKHGRQDAKIEERGLQIDTRFTFHPQRCTLCGEPCNYNKRRGWYCLACDVTYSKETS